MEIQINLDCADLDRMVTFYTAALGYVAHGTAGTTYASIVPANGAPGPKVVFQRVPEPKSAKNRMHLDIVVGDAIEAEAERWAALGATRGEHVREHGGEWIVMRDPEGNEICLCNC